MVNFLLYIFDHEKRSIKKSLPRWESGWERGGCALRGAGRWTGRHRLPESEQKKSQGPERTEKSAAVWWPLVTGGPAGLPALHSGEPHPHTSVNWLRLELDGVGPCSLQGNNSWWRQGTAGIRQCWRLLVPKARPQLQEGRETAFSLRSVPSTVPGARLGGRPSIHGY